MKLNIKKYILMSVAAVFLSACHDDLDQTPTDPDILTETEVFSSPAEAKSALAKLYASLTLTGQEGPAGNADISGIDEGFSQYTRMLFYLNELTTDHAILGWGDPGVPDLHGMYWGAGNDFAEGMYSRLAQEVSFCNSFIENASALSSTEVEEYIAEARFLRAFAYYNLIDLYANVPLTTTISTELPQQSNRQEIFNFIESELLDIQETLVASGANEYGRVDRVAAWALLSKLYLNAEAWTGTAKWDETVTYSDKVMNSSYSLFTTDLNGNGTAYDELFLADNGTNGAQNEFIFPVNFDGLHSQTYGGTTFIIHGAIGGTMDPTDFGVNGGWAGMRSTSALSSRFSSDIDDLNTALGTLSDWGLVGSSTTNGWNGPDMEMYETSTNVYALYANLVTGEIKFRYDEDWGNNYGDTGADGTVDAGGDNITIPSAGTYLVTLNLNDNTYTISPFSGDKRGMFYTTGMTDVITDISSFDGGGYPVTKFKNITSTGENGSDASGNFADTDLALIRLPEIYFNYAEATLRGGNGSMSTALEKINEVRARAFGSDDQGQVTSIDLDFVLDERSRELYWEGQRRTDLVRYGYFTSGSYLWPYKGNVAAGQGVDDYRNIFPIPSNILSINTNMTQNTGY